MKTKKLVPLILCLSLAIGMTSCGQKTSPKESEVPTPTPEPTSAAASAYTPGTYRSTVPGLWGDLTVETVFDENMIVSVTVIEDAETPGVREYPLTLIPERILESQSLNIDSVSGASVTSNAILTAVANCVEDAGGDVETLKKVTAKKESLESSYNADVVIIGGGGAGLSAATAASEAGASVLLLEKAGFLGGSSVVSGGIYNCADPALQEKLEMSAGNRAEIEAALKEHPVNEAHAKLQADLAEQYEAYNDAGATYLFDSPEWHALQTWIGGDRVGDLDLIFTLTNNAYAGLEWMKDMGMEVQERIGQGAGSLYMRTHYTSTLDKPQATNIISTFTTVLEGRDNVQILMETTGKELIMADGTVTGVKAQSRNGEEITITANQAVIIATGGFARNVEMRQKYCEGDKWPNLGAGLNCTNMPANMGDGILMAEEIGADLVDMDQIQILHVTNPVTGITGDACMPLSTAGLIFVNQDGNRFWREDGRRDDLSLAAMEQNEKGKFWIIENTVAIPDMDTLTIDGRPVGFLIENGISESYSADTLEELAEKIGVNPQNLKSAVAQYNTSVDTGVDEMWGRTLLTYKFEEDQGPWYAISRAPAAHHTMGGIHINTEAQVINTDNEIIKGLYACGEVVGGIHGGNRLGGNAIVDFLVFGRIAGTNAATDK